MFDVDDDVLKSVNNHFYIPPKPEILAQLQSYCGCQDVTIREISDLIAQDISVASAILKIVNSPSYGLGRTVADIKQAVMFLGLQGVTTLVQSIKLKQAYSSQDLDLNCFWQHTNNLANTILVVGRHVKSIVPVEDLYSLGLFHDSGIPPLILKHPDYRSVAPIFNTTDPIQVAEEQLLYSTHHGIVGYFIASSWALPKDLCLLILEHHNQEFLHSARSIELQASYAALKLSEYIVHSLLYDKPDNDWPYVEGPVLEFLGINQDDVLDLKEDVADVIAW